MLGWSAGSGAFVDAGREETAHRVAWAAVKNSYKQGADDRWQKLD